MPALYTAVVVAGEALVHAGMPAAIVITCLLFAALLVIPLVLRFLLHLTRFCVILHATNIQLGRGLSRLILAYEDVDIIRSGRTRHGCFVRLQGGKDVYVVRLSEGDASTCAEELRIRCPNAILIDALGNERLPPNPTRPDQVVEALLSHNRLKTHSYAILGAIFGGIAVVESWFAVQSLNAQPPLDRHKLLSQIVGLAVNLGIAIALFYQAKKNSVKTRWIEQRVSTAFCDSAIGSDSGTEIQ